jgi:hypothetical protein
MTKQVSETVVKRMLSKLDNGERIAHGPPLGTILLSGRYTCSALR